MNLDKPFSRWNADFRQISVKEHNRELDKLERLGKYDLPQQQSVDGPGGLSAITDNYKIDVVITGGANPYSWTEVLTTNSAPTQAPTYEPWIRQSDLVTLPAWERNHNTSVPAGTVVTATINPVLQILTFDFEAGAGGGTEIVATDGTVIYNTTTLVFPGGTLTQPGGAGTPVTYSPDGEHDLNAWKQHGEWYTSNNTGGISFGFGWTTSLYYFIPVIVTRARSLQALGFYLGSQGGFGALVEIALYNVQNDAAILPHSPIAQFTNIDVGPGNGGPGIMKAFATSKSVGPGLYWLGFGGNDSSAGIAAVNGIISPLPVRAESPTQLSILEPAMSYPSGWPNDPCTINDGVSGGTGPYLAWMF